MKKCLSIILSVLMLLSACAVSVSAADEECQHNYTESYYPPTCVEDGYFVYVCSNCGDNYKQSANAPALGHNFGAWYEIDKAECIYEGHEKRDCTRCNGSETKTIPVLGHIDENGNKKCDRCDQPMGSGNTIAPFDWLIALFQAIVQFFKDIFA